MAVVGLTSVCFISCENKSNDPAEILRERIDKAEMIEYIDKSPYCNLCERKEICPSRVNHALACPGFIKENKK